MSWQELLIHNGLILVGLVAWLEVRFRPIALRVVAREEQQSSLLVGIGHKVGVEGITAEAADRIAQGQVPDLAPIILAVGEQIAKGVVKS